MNLKIIVSYPNSANLALEMQTVPLRVLANLNGSPSKLLWENSLVSRLEILFAKDSLVFHC